LLGWVAIATRSHTVTLEFQKKRVFSGNAQTSDTRRRYLRPLRDVFVLQAQEIAVARCLQTDRHWNLGKPVSAAEWNVSWFCHHAGPRSCNGLVSRREHQISLCMDKWKELSSKQIETTYAREFPNYWSKLDERETVWQPRYYDFNLYSEGKMHEKLEYMHNNPVRAGLAKDICDWPWSSAQWWHQGRSVGIPVSWHP